MEKMSEAEYEIMQIIWTISEWFIPSELQERIGQDKNWSYSTIRSFLARLAKKGLLECKAGRTNQYHAIISEQEYKNYETSQFMNSIHKGSLRSMLASLCNHNVSEEKLLKLMDEIENMREE